uniref:Uncharacterized protein n=1 Tax=Amphimedon queenslandica TaxID=400682 RepID=A0A1X7VX33_AMPQE
MFHALLAINPGCNVWVAFGVVQNFQYIHIDTVNEKLGCDTTSIMNGRGTKNAMEAWKLTNAFTTSINPYTLQFKLLKNFCVDTTSSQSSVYEARKELFCQKNQTMESISPLHDALLQNTKRAAYQSYIWRTSDESLQLIPSPEGIG